MSPYSTRYSDFKDDAAAELLAAHHVRILIMPSGRKLYMAGTRETDAEEIADLQAVAAACNLAPAEIADVIQKAALYTVMQMSPDERAKLNAMLEPTP